MEGDTIGGGDQRNIFGETDPCCVTDGVSCKVKARKHVAVIESSESEDELHTACSFVLQPPHVDLKIKKSHSTIVPDSDDSSCCEDLENVMPAVETTKFVHQLDWDAWRKRKEEETRQKKLLQQQKAEEKAKIINDQCEYAKHMAWVNWVCKKKNDELQKKVNEIESQRIHEKFKTEKEKIAKEKFEQWFKKKQQHDLLKKQCKLNLSYYFLGSVHVLNEWLLYVCVS